jgi:hypothetical protein
MPKGKVREQQPDEFEERFQQDPTEDLGNPEDLFDEDDAAPVAEDNESDEGETEEPEGTEEETEEEEEPETAPAPKKYKIQGKEYTVDELVKAGLLDKVVTQSEQAVHYQDLYHGIKSQVDQITQQQNQQAAQMAQRQAPIRPEQIAAAMHPHIAQAVNGGFVEQEFAEMYPNTVATQMYVNNELVQLKQIVTGIYQYFMRDRNEKLFQQVKSNFNGFCETLAAHHPVYANLKKPEEREKFFDYVSTKVNPEAGAINEEFLGQVYLAYQRDNILPVMQRGTDARKGRKNKQRKLAAGESSSAPRKDLRKQAMTDDEAVMNGMLAAFLNQ